MIATCGAETVSLKDLKRALSFYQSMQRLDVAFKQTKILKDMSLKLESEGQLTIQFPDRVEWKIIKPQPMTVELENQKVKITSSSGSQTFSQSENPSAKDRRSFGSMLSWLKLDAEEIWQNFTIKKTGPRRYVFLAKNQRESLMKSLEMELTKNGHLAKIVFIETSSDEIHILFNKPKVVYRPAR